MRHLRLRRRDSSAADSFCFLSRPGVAVPDPASAHPGVPEHVPPQKRGPDVEFAWNLGAHQAPFVKQLTRRVFLFFLFSFGAAVPEHVLQRRKNSQSDPDANNRRELRTPRYRPPETFSDHTFIDSPIKKPLCNDLHRLLKLHKVFLLLQIVSRLVGVELDGELAKLTR